MPVKCIAVDVCFSLKQRNETLSIHVLLRKLIESCHLENGWIEIGADDRCIVFNTCLFHSRPFYNCRNTETSFIQPTLRTTQRKVRCRHVLIRRVWIQYLTWPSKISGGHSSVLGSKYDDDVVVDTEIFKLLDESSHASVNAFNHGGTLNVILNLFYFHRAA